MFGAIILIVVTSSIMAIDPCGGHRRTDSMQRMSPSVKQSSVTHQPRSLQAYINTARKFARKLLVQYTNEPNIRITKTIEANFTKCKVPVWIQRQPYNQQSYFDALSTIHAMVGIIMAKETNSAFKETMNSFRLCVGDLLCNMYLADSQLLDEREDGIESLYVEMLKKEKVIINVYHIGYLLCRHAKTVLTKMRKTY